MALLGLRWRLISNRLSVMIAATPLNVYLNLAGARTHFRLATDILRCGRAPAGRSAAADVDKGGNKQWCYRAYRCQTGRRWLCLLAFRMCRWLIHSRSLSAVHFEAEDR
jgi:hypothetical protein